MKKFALAATAAALGLSAQANAADTITFAEVRGSLGSTVWNTNNADGFYALFLQQPPVGGPVINPNDEAINVNVADNAETRLLLAGDGFPVGSTPNSDPAYNLLLTFASGNTLTGSYTPFTNSFIAGSSFTNGGQTFSLAEFSFVRTLGDSVSPYRAVSGGDGNDYAGNFRVSALAAAGVPEPSTWAMLIVGFGMVGGSMRYGKRQTRTSVKFA